MQEEQKKKEDTLFHFIINYRNSLTYYYKAIYQECDKEDLNLVTGVFDVLIQYYSKEDIINKLYDLYHYDEWKEDSGIMYRIHEVFKKDYHSIIKFGDMLGDDEFYKSKYSMDIVDSVFSGDTSDEMRRNVTRTTLKYVSRFIFRFFSVDKLNEIREEIALREKMFNQSH